MRSRRALFVMVLMSYVLALTAFPYFVFLPAVVKDVFDRGPLELGIINAAAAVGAVIAAVWVAGIVSRRACGRSTSGPRSRLGCW